MSIGKVHKNGTISDGAFYSLSEVNEITKSCSGSDSGNGGGSSGSGCVHYLTIDAETGSLGVSYNDIKSFINNNELVAVVFNATSQQSMVTKTFNYLVGMAKIEGLYYAVVFSDNLLFTSDSINDILTADMGTTPDPSENIS